MANTIFNLREKALDKTLGPDLKAFAEYNGLSLEGDDAVSKEELVKRLNTVQEFMLAQLSGKNFAGEDFEVPQVDIREALSTADVSIVFKRVISEVLQEPKMPQLVLTQLSNKINLGPDTPLSIEFPTLGGLTASDIAEGGEYPKQELSYQGHLTSMRLGKVGLSTSVTDEVIRQSIWPILNLYMKMMTNAVDLKIESKMYQSLVNYSQCVFDNDINSSVASTYRTTGQSVTGTSAMWNATFSYHDLVKLAGVLLGNRYNATHFLAHPLAWPIFATDPLMRAQFYNGGQLGAGIWSREPQFDQQLNFPFAGIQYVPYYALPYSEKDVLTYTGSALASALNTDVYLIDKENSLLLATRGGKEIENMDEWYRDAKMLKIRQYVGVAAYDGGKGMVSAKNLRVVRNEEPLYSVRTITA